MKIKTNVKAGGKDLNQNEKLSSADGNSIEQKKSFGKKLRFSKETIRQLKEVDLKRIAGGEAASGLGCNMDDPFIRCTR